MVWENDLERSTRLSSSKFKLAANRAYGHGKAAGEIQNVQNIARFYRSRRIFSCQLL